MRDRSTSVFCRRFVKHLVIKKSCRQIAHNYLSLLHRHLRIDHFREPINQIIDRPLAVRLTTRRHQCLKGCRRRIACHLHINRMYLQTHELRQKIFVQKFIRNEMILRYNDVFLDSCEICISSWKTMIFSMLLISMHWQKELHMNVSKLCNITTLALIHYCSRYLFLFHHDS